MDTEPVNRSVGPDSAMAGHGFSPASAVVGLVLVCLCCFAVYGPALFYGLPTGDSFEHNIIWLQGLREALAWDNPYPRWLPSLWLGAGSSDFYFYAPLPFYVGAAAGAVCESCDTEQLITLATIVLRVFAALTLMGLANALGFRSVGIVAACLLILGPYQFHNWYGRQAFGEIAGASLLPLFLWGLLTCLRHGRWWMLTLGTALVALSHLPTLVVACVIGLVLSLTAWRPPLRQLAATAARAVAAGTLGLGLTALYWLPAVTLLDTVNGHLLTRFGWDTAILDFGIEDFQTPYTRIWWPLAALSIAVVWVLRFPEGRALRATILVPVGAIWFLVSPLSALVWMYSPLDVIQFPWRFFAIGEVFLVLGLALYALTMRVQRNRLSSIVLLASIPVIIAGPMIDSWRGPQRVSMVQWMLDKQIGSLEWLGRETVEFTPYDMLTHGPHFVPSAIPVAERGEVLAFDVKPKRLELQLDCPQAGCRIVLPRTYWRFWQITEAVGPEAFLTATPDIPMLVLEAHEGAGSYAVDLINPWSERVGWWVSLSSLVLLILALAKTLLQRPQRRDA
ncbi:MAG: hypothetical protein AAF674_14905 [Pseudomonadota bacterium]